MRTRPKDVGTAAETAVVRWARLNGFPHADRVALRGRADAGDVRLTPGLTAGVVLEVKAGAQARAAQPADVARWRAQTTAEREAAGAAVALLVLQRGGYGPARAGMWWVLWDLADLAPMEGAALAGSPHFPGYVGTEVRTTLADALWLLRLRGWGEPLDPAPTTPAPDASVTADRHPEGHP